MDADLARVHATLDAIGVERGSLEIRLAYLRGVSLGLVRPWQGWQGGTVLADPGSTGTVGTGGFASPAPAPPDPVAAALGDTEAPLDWDADPDEPEPGKWTDAERRAFFASLQAGEISDPYDVIAAYCESRGAPRPSVMTADQRNKFLASLTKDEPLQRYREWAAIHGPDVVTAAKAARKAAKAAAKQATP